MHQPRTLSLIIEKARIMKESMARGFSSRAGSKNVRNSRKDA